MIKAGVIGATGYAGAEVVRLLYGHPDVEIVFLASKSYAGKKFHQMYHNFTDLIDEPLCTDDLASMAKDVDVIFTATPQGYLAGLLTKDILEQVKIIDLSADYRLTDVNVYEKWYGIKHESAELIKNAVYGLCEVNRERIKKTRLLANPGCYTTCSILTVLPLIKASLIDEKTLIIDAKSGTSGAGRGAKMDTLFCEVNENMKAYGVATHRHTPEIEEQLSVYAKEPIVLNFTPHLVPMNRGILVTAYAKLNGSDIMEKTIRKAYEACYKDEPFVRILEEGVLPETKWVRGSNYTDINFVIDKRTNRIIMVGALDNLIKGAAGQAIQNMNLLFGLEETSGLLAVPMFP